MLVLIPFLLLELYLSLAVGEEIGFFWSVVWIIVSIVVGIRLFKNSPYAMVGNIQAVKSGKLSLREFENASVAYFTGAILLIVPGVLSDIVGILFFTYTLYLQFVVKITPENLHFNQTTKGEKDVIDVEIIDEYTDRGNHS